MSKPRNKWAFRLEGILILILAACLPLPGPQDIAPTPTPTHISLPPTWTVIPYTETPWEASNSPSAETPGSQEATAVAPLGSQTPTSNDLVPFQKLSMVSDQAGWAWGATIDLGTRIWRTMDAGQTWYEVSPEREVRSFVFALDSTTAWAIVCLSAGDECEPGLSRTTDGGETWPILSDEGFYAYWNAEFTTMERGMRVEYDVGAGSGFWSFSVTSDGGATWERMEIHSDHFGDELDFGYRYQTCNLCGDLLYLDQELLLDIDGNLSMEPADFMTLWVSFDLGTSWQSVELDFPAQISKPGIFHANQPIVLEDRTVILPVNLAPSDQLDSAMVFYESDNGQSWHLLSVVESVGNVNGWNHFDILQGQDIAFVCGNDLCLSRDGAQTWERISSNLAYSYSRSGPYMKEFDFVDTEHGWALVEPEFKIFSLWRTSDGGRSWMKLTPELISK
ncbi:MAG: hypothetical protein AB8I40_02420 [Anaerolineales bacterium]